jgi:hypothetical protein
MIDSIRFTWQLLVLASLMLVAGVLLLPHFTSALSTGTYLATLSAVTFITLISYLVAVRGMRKNDRDGMALLLAGIGLKFLLYLAFLLVVWVVTKNLTKAFILIFFTLYLVFTFFLAIHLLKMLRNK